MQIVELNVSACLPCHKLLKVYYRDGQFDFFWLIYYRYKHLSILSGLF